MLCCFGLLICIILAWNTGHNVLVWGHCGTLSTEVGCCMSTLLDYDCVLTFSLDLDLDL